MDCPKCGKKMLCRDSACINNVTARRYVCPDCKVRLHTTEKQADMYEVNQLLAHKWKRLENVK